MSSTTEPTHDQRIGHANPGMGWAASEAINHHQALHNPGELSLLLALLEAVSPRLLLEIGTWAGGSAWAFSRVTSLKHIITVDMDPRPEAADRLASLPCRATQIVGRSDHQDTVKAVTAALDGFRPDVVFIDGGHEYRTARSDFDLYGALTETGGLVVLHDTQGYPGNDTVQVPQLWAELRQTYRTTELADVPGGPGGTGIVWF